jgi:hypothetical protein
VNQSVRPREDVTLNATASVDTNDPPLPLTYSWKQTGGTHVVLTAAKTATPTFTAPPAAVPGAASPPITLEFTVAVSNGLASSAAVTTVTVARPVVPTDTLTAVTADFRLLRDRLTVTATTSDPAAVVTLVGFGEMGPGLPPAIGVPPAPGDRLIRIVGLVQQPATVTVRSSSGAEVTVPVTVR